MQWSMFYGKNSSNASGHYIVPLLDSKSFIQVASFKALQERYVFFKSQIIAVMPY